MAAGQGFKTFTTGEVLTAGDVNGYLMQGINVFTNATARDAAITAPAEGQFAFTKDNNSLWYYDGAAWVASGATGDIEGVTAGVGISGGGTSGTVTITNSMATAIDAKGDLVAGTGADAFSRLAVGTNGTVLTADSAEATGMKWATSGASFSGLSMSASNQSIATGTYTALAFATEQFDVGGFHDTVTNNTRVTIPAGKAGYYQFNLQAFFNANASGTREMLLYKNGSAIYSSDAVYMQPSGTNGNTTNSAVVVSAAVSDYFQLFVYQTSGAGLNSNGRLTMSYLGA
jgi:hypothetical protein